MITIRVNNKEMTVETDCTVDKLLEKLDYSPRSSVWINGRQLLLKEYTETILQDRDQVKLLRILGGG
ncbi:MAG: sulfur carrier protein ThiS [Tindallia sp. MSAO_Bac2]|nr:MAG: sulfur carrier protein ThiS [Tindallia sp. MSAO_Bac2]